MGIGQPAMSNSLARLRAMFGDPFLIRTPAGMQPTGRALELVEPISRALAELRREVFGGQTFRPETDRRTLRIGVSDQAEAALMQGALQAIARDAPRVNIVARTVEMRLGRNFWRPAPSMWPWVIFRRLKANSRSPHSTTKHLSVCS